MFMVYLHSPIFALSNEPKEPHVLCPKWDLVLINLSLIRITHQYGFKNMFLIQLSILLSINDIQNKGKGNHVNGEFSFNPSGVMGTLP